MFVPRLVCAFFLSLAVLALAACGSADTPEDVVQAYYKAAAAGDADKTIQWISLSDVDADDMPQAKAKVQMIAAEVQSKAKSNGGLKKVEIVESSTDDANNTARLKVEVFFGNDKKSTESFRLRRDDGKWRIVLG